MCMSTVRSGRRPDRRSTSTTLKSQDVICSGAAAYQTRRHVRGRRVAQYECAAPVHGRSRETILLTRVTGAEGGGAHPRELLLQCPAA